MIKKLPVRTLYKIFSILEDDIRAPEVAEVAGRLDRLDDEVLKDWHSSDHELDRQLWKIGVDPQALIERARVLRPGVPDLRKPNSDIVERCRENEGIGTRDDDSKEQHGTELERPKSVRRSRYQRRLVGLR